MKTIRNYRSVVAFQSLNPLRTTRFKLWAMHESLCALWLHACFIVASLSVVIDTILSSTSTLRSSRKMNSVILAEWWDEGNMRKLITNERYASCLSKKCVVNARKYSPLRFFHKSHVRAKCSTAARTLVKRTTWALYLYRNQFNLVKLVTHIFYYRLYIITVAGCI